MHEIGFDYTCAPVIGIELDGKLTGYFRPIAGYRLDDYAYLIGTLKTCLEYAATLPNAPYIVLPDANIPEGTFSI